MNAGSCKHPITTAVRWLMFTHPRSSLHVLRMPLHLSSGHVTLLPGEILGGIATPSHFPQYEIRRRADLRLTLPRIFSFVVLRAIACNASRVLAIVEASVRSSVRLSHSGIVSRITKSSPWLPRRL